MADTENLPPRRSSRLRSGTTTSQDHYVEPLKSSTIAPLRISKSTSRSKALTALGEDTTLKEVSPGSSRRNSPSTFQIKDKIASFQEHINRSPPTSPSIGIPKSDSANSVRSFWQNATSTEEPGHKRSPSKTDIEKNIRSSLVKNNPFLAKDIRERESSPKLTMSPSQQRLSASLGEVVQKSPTVTNTSRIPAPVDTQTSPRKDMRPTPMIEPKASCLHSNRIKGPRQNASDENDSTPPSRRERRKTVTFDQAPEVHEYDRRSSHGTTASDQSSQYSENQREDTEYKGVPASRPLPQIPTHDDSDDERPESKQSNDSDYGDMEERIRSMMERVVLRDSEQKEHHAEHDDIFSLYTNVNEMSDEEPHSQESQSSKVFSSQDTESTALSSQSQQGSLDEERELEKLQKQSEELLQAVRSRPFSLAELPDLGFGDDAEEDNLGLSEYCTPEPIVKKEPMSPGSINTQVNNLDIAPKPPVPSKDTKSQPQQSQPDTAEAITPPITPPLASSETLPEPETPQEQIIPPPETLPSTPPASPIKSTEEDDAVPSPVVPEREATIRSRGGSKLRVRPSLSRQEAEQIVARRRKSEVPPLPDLREGSVEPQVKVKVEEDDMSEFGGKLPPLKKDTPLLKIEPLGFEKDSLGGFSATAVEEMERVIEAQKRGYMMRQHSKVVHASSDGEHLRAAKVQERMASSISVDWGNKRAPQNLQRKAVPQAGLRKPSKEIPKSASTPGLPPQTGHVRDTSKESVAVAPPLVRKNTSGEYGRLFIKVNKLKDLELPLPKGISVQQSELMTDEALYFSCTLDNGLHCVTTPFKLLQREAKIDQEFELIATEKLEFMLTLQVRINLPPAPVKSKGTLGKGALQRFFGSPKKKAPIPVAASKDPYHGLGGIIGRDGSFSRSYVALKTYENAAFGRQFTTDIACLNEWALEPGAGAMRGREMQRMRKRPYLIGKIECQLLFVPSINPVEELPKSMSAAVREMKNAEWFSQLLWEGYLSQQGGDCQHWRRRYFKLVGSSLIGYHETKRDRRATINLAKSTRVVDDRESLIETPPVKGRNGRRKSGFHNEEAEGYMYLEEGFRIWFGNGEVIDFRADTREEKREWVNILQGVVGKVPVRKEWAQAVLERERAMKK